MRIIPGTLLVTMLASTCAAQAGVVVGGTRLIYDGGKKESSLSVNNPDKSPYLIQSWVDTVQEEGAKAPFIITPPLFRLDGGQKNVLRVVRTGGNLPTDKESLYWLNIKSIPSASKDSNQNTLQIAVKTRIKLIYRPQDVKGIPEDVADKLTWSRSDNILKVTNPTPFYMNFQQVKVAGSQLKDVTYVAPGSSATFPLPAGVHSSSVSWKIINDYGGASKEYTGTL